MARPRTYLEDRVATAVRLPASVHRRLHEAAADRHVSANLLVTRAVTEFLNRLTPAEAALRRSAGEPWSATPEAAAATTTEIDA
jgi:predicted transcriptional regulator